MIRIKKDLEILKNTPNYLDLSNSAMSAFEIKDSYDDLISIINMISKRVDHFTQEYLINYIKNGGKVSIVSIPNYILPVTYNIKSGNIVLNLNYFGTNDITRIEPKNVYALMTYGISFKNIIENKDNILKEDMSIPVSDFMTTLIIRMFGKQYGIVGTFSGEIPKIKFATYLYVLVSFFGKEQSKFYGFAGSRSGYDYVSVLSTLSSYDFSNIREYIRFLSDSGAMPGFNLYTFSSRLINVFGISFIPMVDDVSRFFPTMLTSELKGSSLVSGFVSKINISMTKKISMINKLLLRGFK